METLLLMVAVLDLAMVKTPAVQAGAVQMLLVQAQVQQIIMEYRVVQQLLQTLEQKEIQVVQQVAELAQTSMQ
jgi:hypothetical protein